MNYTSLRRAMKVALPVGLVASLSSVSPLQAERQLVASSTATTDTGATVPTLDLQPCGGAGALCSAATVPLDYDDPHGDTITLSVAVVPATDPANKIGALFVNVGGPGGASAQEVRAGLAAVFPESVRARFDIVGIDPRGVGESSPIRCFGSLAERNEVLGAAPSIPVSDSEVQARLFVARQYGQACAANAGPLLRHMSTANVARDHDLLRAALGDEQFTYVGLSYGTHLGTVYANLFPDRVRAVALDANLDAVGWSTGRRGESQRSPFTTRIQSAIGSANTLDGFLSECAFVGPTRCAFAENGDPAVKWEELRNRLRQGPIDVTLPDGSAAQVTYSSLVIAVIGSLYAPPSSWGNLALGLEQIYVGANVGEGMVRLERLAAQARSQYRFADEPFDDSFLAVVCSETENPTSQSRFVRNARREEQRFGAAGENWAWAAVECATWPVKDDDRYLGPYDTPTANPILLINNFFDPATSFESAVELQSQLANAQLLPVAGYGHVAFPSSSCATAALATYLLYQQLPPADLVCPQDVVAFQDVLVPEVPAFDGVTVDISDGTMAEVTEPGW
jgi:pimeloyl-ACP methyl ester carboxylesterase